MAGDCAYETRYVNDDTFGNKQMFGKNQELAVSDILDTAKGGSKSIKAVVSSPYFEIIDGVMYRKKLEKGYIRYREVLDRSRHLSVIATFHEEPPGKRHHTLDDTYRTVADNYWWDGMYFHIREYVLSCPQCKAQHRREEVQDEPRISRTLASHGNALLLNLCSQREAGLFCDITLKTGSRTFSAHRAVLAGVSEYFQEIFTEMDSDGQPNVDLSGFREESVLPLLEFSYTSTLSLSAGDLAEVSALAQHFRMWAAVEACRALQSEQRGATPEPAARTVHQGPRPTATGRAEGMHKKRSQGWSLGGPESVQSWEGHVPAFDSSGNTPSRRGWESQAPVSPVCRLKLLDFKSPSSKVKTPSKNLPAGMPLLQAHADSQLSPLLSSSTKRKQRLSWTETGAGPGPAGAEQSEGEGLSPQTQEKYRLLSMLGLQRRSLLPRPVELTGWRQKKRLRKLKVSSYALTAPRKPRASTHGHAASLPLRNGPVSASPKLLQGLIKTEPPEPISMEDMSMAQGWGRSLPSGATGRRELRRSVRGRTAPLWNPVPVRRSIRLKQEPDAPSICPQPLPTPSTVACPRGRPRKNPPPVVQSGAEPSFTRPRGRPRRVVNPASTPPLGLNLLAAIKEEPTDNPPVTIATPTPVPTGRGRRQRQSKPPLKLLDPGFVFPLSRLVGGVKQEEVVVPVWQVCVAPGASGVSRTRRSPRHALTGLGFDRKQLQAKGPPAPLLKKKAVRRRLMDGGATGGLPRHTVLGANRAKQTGERPKNLSAVPSLHQRLAVLESIRQARMKRLRGRRSHTPVTSHTCLQCKAAYRNCDALIMHRIRHIEGKHWPCPLCSKTFFRQRNVQSHIRTHDPKLYKCSRCISAT